MTLRDKVTKEMLEHFPIPKEKQHPSRPCYFNDYADNLPYPMDEKVEQAYLEGDGDSCCPGYDPSKKRLFKAIFHLKERSIWIA